MKELQAALFSTQFSPSWGNIQAEETDGSPSTLGNITSEQHVSC